MEIQSCPVLRPSWKEFRNFYQYVESVDALYKHKYGMVKMTNQLVFSISPQANIQVIPPPQWHANLPNNSHRLQSLMVNGPIQQNIFGKSGVYECLHIQKKSMSFKEYKSKLGLFDKITEELSTDEIEAMVTMKLCQFWKNIVFSPPLYGADLLNTLMDDSAGSWNLNKLDSVLNEAIDVNVRGVTSSYCYIGSWKALFCWHRQDLDLSAINYLHEGKSKFWYSIPNNQSHILQKQAKTFFPEHFLKCSEHLRHKTTLINPYTLKKKHPQLSISKIQHKPGQFMLVFGGSYHCGFNFGVNIAEAINYATLDWLRQLPESKPCSCSKGSVKANLPQIMKNLEKSKFSKSKQFLNFKKRVFEQAVKQEEEQEKEAEKKTLKLQYSKKIKKSKKFPSKLNVNGEEYKVENWAQCDSCSQWRRISKPLIKKQFRCHDSGKTCSQKEVYDRNYISL